MNAGSSALVGFIFFLVSFTVIYTTRRCNKRRRRLQRGRIPMYDSTDGVGLGVSLLIGVIAAVVCYNAVGVTAPGWRRVRFEDVGSIPASASSSQSGWSVSSVNLPQAIPLSSDPLLGTPADYGAFPPQSVSPQLLRSMAANLERQGPPSNMGGGNPIITPASGVLVDTMASGGITSSSSSSSS